MTQNLLSTIKSKISSLQNQKLIVGVSGGPDSMALLDCLYQLQQELGLSLVVAHMEHGFRGQNSIEDAEYVRKYSEQHNLVFRMNAVNMPEIVKEQQGSAQELARKVRYQWFAQLAEEYNTPYIVLGHHKDDQIETILMRIIRGTSITGLSGIEDRSERNQMILIRPMLSIHKDQIVEYCRTAGIEPRVDASNEDSYYLRNKVRNCLLPQLARDYNDNINQSLYNLGELAKEDSDYFQSVVEEVSRTIVTEVTSNRQYKVLRSEFNNIHIALQRRLLLLLLYYLKTEARFEKKHIDSIIVWIQTNESGGVLQLPGDVTIIREAEAIVLIRGQVEQLPLSRKKLEIGQNVLSNGTIVYVDSMLREKGQRYTDSQKTVFFDSDGLKGMDLYCRSRNNGDRMTVFGMEGSKKVKDIYIDAKIPSHKRDQVPIITAEDTILWLAGIRRSNIAPVTRNSKELVRIQYIDN